MTTSFSWAIDVRCLVALLGAAMLSACNPTYNWRDYASPDTPFRVMFPAKPATFTKEIDLDGLKVAMTMTAAEVEGATFAVGTAQAPDAARAQAAVEAMRIALVRNIDGRVTRERNAAVAGNGEQMASDIEAEGTVRGMPMHLSGHFEARGKRIYQVIVIGKAKSVPTEQVEQFLGSFKPL